MTNVPWPKELLQRCIELWREGHDAKKIGEELGKTKNAIIGRMTRMRVTTGDLSLLRREPALRIGPKVPKEPRVRKPSAEEEPTRVRAQLWIPPPPIGETACRLEHLTLKTCRWPVGEATGEHQLFCGLLEAELDDNRPYCEGHSQLAYRDDIGRINLSTARRG